MMFEDFRVTTKSQSELLNYKKVFNNISPITLQQSHEILKKRHINTNIQLMEQFIEKCFQVHKTASQHRPEQLKKLETRLKTEKTTKEKH